MSFAPWCERMPRNAEQVAWKWDEQLVMQTTTMFDQYKIIRLTAPIFQASASQNWYANTCILALTDKLRGLFGTDNAFTLALFSFGFKHGAPRDADLVLDVRGLPNPSVTADPAQLCIEGLKHGERYQVTLRQGLPSSVSETLLRSADYELYVRDRATYARELDEAVKSARSGVGHSVGH